MTTSDGVGNQANEVVFKGLALETELSAEVAELAGLSTAEAEEAAAAAKIRTAAAAHGQAAAASR